MEKGGRNVLVVDDDPDMRDVLQSALESFGFTTYVADDGDVALELFTRHNPELIITDIYMPRFDGIRLLREIKSKTPQIKVILITGYSYLDREDHQLDIVPDALLRKPFALKELMRVITDVTA